MNPDLAVALQALSNQYNVILAVQETPETPAPESQTFTPQPAATPEAELPAAPTEQPTA
jgi:hypothetical protein